MLDVMRYFPSGIRSVVLESTLPPEVNYDEVGVDKVVRTLNMMFSECRSDAACNKAYPQLEKEFYAVVARLNAKPLRVDTPDPKTQTQVPLDLDGDDFATWIVDYLFSNEPAATVEAPMVIHKAFDGDYVRQFRAYAGDKLGAGSYSLGMRYSVWCSEERPFESRAKIEAQSTKYSGLRGYEIMALPDICMVWKVKGASVGTNRAVRSGIPSLVIGAQYDAYTDPAWGRSVSARLSKSHFVEIPWAGHGPAFSVPCVAGMIADFFDDPGRASGTECVESTRRQFKFVTR